MKATNTVEPQLHNWTKQEYYKMVEMGFFEGKHVELIEGQIIEMSPMGSLHRTAITLAAEILRNIFVGMYFISIQCPMDLGETSDPEPDIAVISGEIRDYKYSHPTSAVLIVEVADTSLDYDRNRKSGLYARAGIEDYWIINLNSSRLEVYRNPISDPEKPYGYSYSSIHIFTALDSVSPLGFPQSVISVADLLP
jgi:Uma2 family endonuclease